MSYVGKTCYERGAEDVKSVFSRLARGIKAIEDGIRKIAGDKVAEGASPFMMHELIGCVTCCPSNVGTGMRGGVHIKVPNLIKKHGLEGIDKMCREKNCQARGSSGEHSEVVDRIDVSNWRRLGSLLCKTAPSWFPLCKVP